MFKVQWSYFRVWISKLTVQTSKFRAFWTDLKYLRPFHTSSNGKNSWCWCVFQLQHVSKLWIQIITLYICVFLIHTEWMFDHFHAIDIVKTRRIAFQCWKVIFSATICQFFEKVLSRDKSRIPHLHRPLQPPPCPLLCLQVTWPLF